MNYEWSHSCAYILDAVDVVVLGTRPIAQVSIEPSTNRERRHHVLSNVPFADHVCRVVAAPLEVGRQQRVGEVQTERRGFRERHVDPSVNHVPAACMRTSPTVKQAGGVGGYVRELIKK
jgi:hypothetical protein